MINMAHVADYSTIYEFAFGFLSEVWDGWHDEEELSDHEAAAKARLIELCKEISNEHTD